MKFCYLEGKRMTDRAAAHAHLKEVLGLPDYYGNNLDALYDCLTDIGEYTLVCLTGPETVREHLGDYGDKLIATLWDAGAENPNLHVVFWN